MQVVRWGGLAVLFLLVLILAAGGCRREAPSGFDTNLPPESYVTGAPAESSAAFYRVHLHWSGSDPDGIVDHFEFAVTDTTKVPGEDNPTFDGFFRTERTDSVFILTANDPQALGHRFYVRSVDNEGKVDPTPAWIYFVAEDYNDPSVYFLAASGEWTDASGQRQSTSIASQRLFGPTDTIGVGGALRFRWCGYDLDNGPFNPSQPCRPQDLLGFEFRPQGSEEFRGGSLADTVFSTNLALPPGSEPTRLFSGSYALRVRGIDEAGARTNPEAVRSVVVNFSPRAWIVDPDNTSPPVRKKVFKDTDTQSLWDSGTHLSGDTRRNIEFLFTGLDDERDSVVVPANPNGITGFSYRKLIGGSGLAFKEITDWKQYPEPSNFSIADARNLLSGDFSFLVRARDVLGRWGASETLHVSVNYFPYFVSVQYADTDSTYADLWNPGGGDLTITLTRDQFGQYPDVEIQALASDEHRVPPLKHPLDPNPVVEDEINGKVNEYRMNLNGERSGFVPAGPSGTPIAKFYPVSETGAQGALRAGTNELVLSIRDDAEGSVRKTDLTVTFTVILQ